MTEEDRERYEASLKAYRDYYACLEFREEKGRREGFSEGRQEGEIEERAKIARAMKSKGFSAEEIAGITGLPIEEARQLWVFIWILFSRDGVVPACWRFFCISTRAGCFGQRGCS